MVALERHYSVKEVAEMWGVSHDTISRLFQDEPTVLKLGEGETRFKRKRITIRIPESTVMRTHERIRARKDIRQKGGR